jgi:hypothetical protein
VAIPPEPISLMISYSSLSFIIALLGILTRKSTYHEDNNGTKK